MTVKAVLFDLDNTLADRDAAFIAWARWFARDRLALAEGDETGAFVDEMIRLDAGGHGSKENMFAALKTRYPRLNESETALLAAFRADLIVHLPPLNDGAVELLDTLDRAGIPWGIVSNGSNSQLEKVRTLDLDARAKCVLISEVVGLRKPDPAIFLAAAEELGVAPARILFVGDQPEADVIGASDSGMRTAWLRRGQQWPGHLAARMPGYTIDSLAELIPIFETR